MGDSGKLLGDILKQAVSTGAKVYLSAEDKIKEARESVQIPKEMLKDAVENFFRHYSITITADIQLKPRDKEAVAPLTDKPGE